MYAWRGKIGLISQIGENMEHAFHRYAPEGVSTSATKIPSPENAAELLPELKRAAALYKNYDADILAVAPELGMCVQQESFDRDCAALSELAGGKPVVTGGQAALTAFRALGGCRIAVITPYDAAANEAVVHYLKANGLDVVSYTGMDMTQFDLQHLPYETADRDFLYKNAREIPREGAEALFFCGECLGTMEIIAALEGDIHLPVVTSQQALLWAALRDCRINAKDSRLGKLFTI